MGGKSKPFRHFTEHVWGKWILKRLTTVPLSNFLLSLGYIAKFLPIKKYIFFIYIHKHTYIYIHIYIYTHTKKRRRQK